MSTHYLLSSSEPTNPIVGYNFYDLDSEQIATFQPFTQVTVLEEFVGNLCNFHKILLDDNSQLYVLSEFINKLPSTLDSAPYVCSNQQKNYSYVEPEWSSLPIDKPFFNEKTLEYCMPIVVNSINLNNLENLKLNAKKDGLSKLLEYYNKKNDESTIKTLLNYYIFANVKDIYVPYRPLQKIKMLISVENKYFDAVPYNIRAESEPIAENENGNFIVRFDTNTIKTIFKSVELNLKNYNDDIYFSNSKIEVRLGTDGNGVFNSSKQIRQQLSLLEKSQKINKFFNSLSNLLLENNFDINQKDQFIELLINDECNIIYDVSVNSNSSCKQLRVGIKQFLKTDPINDPTTVCFVKNADRISKIEKCKVAWPEFVETYVYPRTIVRNISINDVVQNFEKNKYEYLRDFLQLVNSFQEQQKLSPVKSYKQVFEEEAEIAKLKTTAIWDLFSNSPNIGPLYRQLYKGDNFFDRSNIDKTLENLEVSISQSPPTSNKKFAYSPQLNIYKVVEETKDENGNIVYKFTEDQQQKQLNDLILFDKVSPNKTVETNSGNISSPIYLAKNNPNYSKTGERFFFIQLYEILNKVGLCTIVDFTNNCVSSLAREFISADFDVSIAVGQITSLSSKEVKEDVVPYLPKEQQEFVYNELLNKISCLNSYALLYILKRTLPEQQYTELGLENASYEDIVFEVSKLMSTSPQ